MARHRLWYLALASIIVLIGILDYVFEIPLIGGAFRAFVEWVSISARFLGGMIAEALAPLMTSVGARRILQPLTAAGTGVALEYWLDDERKISRIRQTRWKARTLCRFVRRLWHRRSFAAKLVIAIGMVGIQLWLWHVLKPYFTHGFWLLFFPIGFVASALVRRTYAAIADMIVGTWYRRYLSRFHRWAIRCMKRFHILRAFAGPIRLLRMFILTGWRLFRYEYRDYGEVKGRELLIRDFRRLSQYRKHHHPLLAGSVEEDSG